MPSKTKNGDETFVVLDLETTGLSPDSDHIIEVACVRIRADDFSEIERFSSLVHPGVPIPDLISQITNIFDTDVENAPNFSEIRDELEDFIGSDTIIGHNIQFDIRFLKSHGIPLAYNEQLDTFLLANFLLRDYKSLNLGYIAGELGITLQDAHRALDDTLATSQVFTRLIELLQALPEQTRSVISYFFSRSSEGAVRGLVQKYLADTPPVNLDTLLEDYLDTLRENIVVPKEMSQGEHIVDIEKFLRSMNQFELRENQFSMLKSVDSTLTNGEKLAIEAPTGIGKTFAYSLPAIKYSLATGQTVHISTSTKALQDQIFYKDLANIAAEFPESFSYTKLKGKRNYLSVQGFLEFLDTRGPQLSAAELGFILKIFLWSRETEFGELDELDYYGEEYTFINQLHAGNSFVFDEANPFSDVEFIIRARNRAKKANIVITNNHILFQDSLSDGSLLGGVKNLIIDEAHCLEEVVTQSMKQSISFSYLQTLLDGIDKKIKKYSLDLSEYGIMRQTLLFQASDMFGLLEGTIFASHKLDDPYKNVLLQPAYYDNHPELVSLGEGFFQYFQTFMDMLSETSPEILKHIQREYQDLGYFRDMLKQMIIERDFSKYIFYISHDEYKGTQLISTLLHPGEFLENLLWKNLESVVLTSATLQMDDDFAYLSQMLSLGAFEKVILPSDFDYAKQALVFIPQDLGSIKNNLSEVTAFLEQFFSTVGGQTLALFTSFSVIRSLFSALKKPLEHKGIHLLAQSISGSKQKQIDFFRHHASQSVLMGTDTFWEGIDIPGEDLTYLVVHKIPFTVPSDPIFQARSKLFAKSFEQYAIPKATLKLKQGFGRLIRSKRDSGIIVFLDDRIFSTQWGEAIYKAFPKDIKIRSGDSQGFLKLLERK